MHLQHIELIKSSTIIYISIDRIVLKTVITTNTISLMAISKTSKTATLPINSKQYSLRNRKDIKMFIPSVAKSNKNKQINKRKLIKKLPKDKPLKGKRVSKNQIKGESSSRLKKKQQGRKIIALIYQRRKKEIKQNKRGISSSSMKKIVSVTKQKSSLKKVRSSLRLKKIKQIMNLFGEKTSEPRRLKNKKQRRHIYQSQRSNTLKKPIKQQSKRLKEEKDIVKRNQLIGKFSKKNSSQKIRPKSFSRAKNRNSSPNIKVIPPRQFKNNLNSIRSEEESAVSKASAASRSKQVVLRYKTIAELQRINRSREQRIFLLNAERTQSEGWVFKVIGTKGKIYQTKVSDSLFCSCIDFRSKRKPCKHIYFIITQIAQNQNILQGFSSQRTISEAAYEQLNQNLFRRLKARISDKKAESEVKQQIDLKDDKDCVICFTEMNQSEQTLQDCKACKKYFHDICIKKWRIHNNSCPLCRNEFEIYKDQRDPLQKFQELKI